MTTVAPVVAIPNESIKGLADYQQDWGALIPRLRPGRFTHEPTSTLSIQGDAPKCFLRVKEYLPGKRSGGPGDWPKYIGKVGSKFYPVESITEHLITRIGEECGFAMAKSRLMVVGQQVRFLSRYFLRKKESLVHGIEIFQADIGKDMVEEIAERRMEREFYTFPTVVHCIKRAFPDDAPDILNAFVAMLVFDAFVGNNDRHPANWGIITRIERGAKARFSPIYDSARGLFWNNREEHVDRCLQHNDSLDSYIRKSRPLIGWDDEPHPNHFQLIRLLLTHFPEFRKTVEDAHESINMEKCSKMVLEEFSPFLSDKRLLLVCRCLTERSKRLADVLSEVGGGHP